MAFRPNPLSIMRKEHEQKSVLFLEWEKSLDSSMSIKLKKYSTINQNNGRTEYGFLYF
jgi:hypothetical protein